MLKTFTKKYRQKHSKIWRGSFGNDSFRQTALSQGIYVVQFWNKRNRLLCLFWKKTLFNELWSSPFDSSFRGYSLFQGAQKLPKHTMFLKNIANFKQSETFLFTFYISKLKSNNLTEKRKIILENLVLLYQHKSRQFRQKLPFLSTFRQKLFVTSWFFWFLLLKKFVILEYFAS